MCTRRHRPRNHNRKDNREAFMQRIGIIIATAAAITIGAAPAGAQQQVTLNLVTAGDQNMVDYVKDYLGPMFEKEHPGVTVRAVGTGPGDAGSQKIYEKLEAEKANSSWDIDVAVIHQKAAGEMVSKGLLARYVPDVPTGNSSPPKPQSERLAPMSMAT